MARMSGAWGFSNRKSTLKCKRLSPLATIPHRANPDDAGLDLTTIEDVTVQPGERKLVSTGLAVSMPPGVYGRVAPRSGLALNFGVDTMAGVIDPGFQGVFHDFRGLGKGLLDEVVLIRSKESEE